MILNSDSAEVGLSIDLLCVYLEEYFKLLVICVYACIYACICACAYIYMYVCMHVYMHLVMLDHVMFPKQSY